MPNSQPNSLSTNVSRPKSATSKAHAWATPRSKRPEASFRSNRSEMPARIKQTAVWAFNWARPGRMVFIANMNTMRPGLAQLKAQTAVCFILAGISLRLLRKEASGRLERGVAQACALLVALLGLLTLVDKLFGWELGIDQWVLRPNVAGSAAHGPSRMALMIALNFFLLGCALLVLDVETRGGYSASQFLTMLAGLASWSVILDSTLNPALSYLYLALPTALLFGVLCTGVLLVRPDRGLVDRKSVV